MKDTIVVGAGPSGSWIGGKLAEKGFDVTILEEHGEIGQPMCCAGILGANRLREIGVNPLDWSINELTTGAFHSHKGKTLEISRGKTEACVIDRSKLDRDLAERAVRKGAEIKLNTKCVGIERDGDGVSVEVKSENGRKEIEGRMVVGADGTNTAVGRSLNLIKDFSPTVCIQAEIVSDLDGNSAHVFLENDISNSFFGWVAPAGDVIRVGTGDREGIIGEKFQRLLEKNPFLPQDPQEKITHYTTGLIPSVNSRKIYDDRTILVGDAAGHVKPLTGGGLYLGLRCADIAADVVEEGLEETPDEEVLSEYKGRVEKKFGEEFEYGRRARRLVAKMSDEDMKEFLNLLGKPKIRKKMIAKADFDHHSELVKEIMKEGPRLIRSFGVKRLVKYINWFVRGD